MNTTKEILSILLMMIVAGLAGFALYHYVIAPRSQVNIIETTRSPKNESLDLEKLNSIEKKSNEKPGLKNLVVKDMNAKPVALDQWPNKTLVINFWATWCPPCRKEIPILIDAQTEYTDEKVQVLGIAMDDPKAVAKYMEVTDFNYPILIGDLNDTIRIGQAFDYNFIALPFTIFVSPDGKTSKAHTGELDAQQLRHLIDQFSLSE